MTQTGQEPETRPSRPIWILWLVAGALVLGCVCSLGALLLLRRAGSAPWIENLWPFTTPTTTALPATATPTPEATPTAAATATVRTSPTPTASPTASATTTQAPTTTATQTAAPTATPTSTSPAPPPASPTPFVCDSVYELAGIRLAPQQTFQCTLREGELTDLANSYPESPCSETRFTFDDGEIVVECRIGVRMRATLQAQIENCRIQIEIVKGTPGFRQIVKDLITTQFDVIQYNTICINQIRVDDGEVIVGGYGR